MAPSARRRAAGLLAGCALLLQLGIGAAAASSGVSVDLGRIDINQQLLPGSGYNLPAIGVRNPGTERTSYVMIASPVDDPDRVSPPSTWFVFEPATVTLDPGQTQRVRVRLLVPTDAAPGDYLVLVGAQIAATGGGATVGAAAAARTTFTITPAGPIEAFAAWFGRSFSDLMPWSGIAPGLVVLGGTLWLIRRRFAVGLRIERRA
jgi:hypothetical protein